MHIIDQITSQKGTTLALEINSNTPEVITCDSSRLRQILNNILTNAAKFTENGYIFIAVNAERRKDNRFKFHFQIKDSGIGTPKQSGGILRQRH